MTKINLMKVMKAEGYEVTEQDMGAKGTGVIIRKPDARVGVTLYKKHWTTLHTDEEAIEFVKHCMSTAPDATVLDDLDADGICRQATLVIKRHGAFASGTTVREYLDLDIAVAIPVNVGDSSGNAMLNASVAESMGMTEDAMFVYAIANVKNDDSITIQSMYDVLKRMLGVDDIPIPEDDESMYVVSRQNGYNAAAALVNTDLFKKFCDDRKLDGCYVLPSSIHEVLIVPAERSEENTERFNEMVKDVNDTQVDLPDQLSDHCYWFNAETCEFEY